MAELQAQGLRRVTPKELAGIDDHHLLPKELLADFNSKEIEINDFLVAVDTEVHRRVRNGLHTKDFKAWLGEWNQNWKNFMKGDPDKAAICDHLKQMIHDLDY